MEERQDLKRRGIRERMRDEGEALAEVEFENSH